MRRSRQAFTLIELLVVIAVIAALGAIIYPAVSEARKRGQTTRIISNMRQLAQAINLYMEDNRLRLPPIDPRPLLKNPAVRAIAYYPHKMATREEIDKGPLHELPFLGDYVYCRQVLGVGAGYFYLEPDHTNRTDPDEIWTRYWGGEVLASPVILVSLHDTGLPELPRQRRLGPYELWNRDNRREFSSFPSPHMPKHVWRCRLDTSVHIRHFSEKAQRSIVFSYKNTCVERMLD